MTPFVARQCHVQGRLGLRLGLRAPRPHWQPAPCARVQRAFATKSGGLSTRAAPIHRANSAILIPSAVEAAQPEDFIQYMSPVSRSNWQDEHGLAVFFLTPSFAKWLHGDETFLKKALAHIYPPVESTARVQALVAVVDKLPVPQYLNLGLPNLDLVNQREQYPPVWDTGLEGVTYRTMSLADASRSVVRSTRDQKGTLSFISSGFHSRRVSSTKTLELPLANTVFQTGSTTTMALSSWEWGPESNFVRKEKSDLVHQAIHIYDSPPYPAFDPKMPNSLSTTSIPLVPLTIPRVVEASMGNILRRITGPDGESATASEELEQMVPQYFAARGLTPQSISVWALLIPHSETSFIEDQTASILQSSQLSNHLVKLSEPWQSLWSSNPPIWNDLGQQAISRGARLHRVISGGGGWGKKAGLLSLDPSINGLEHADSSTESFAEGPEDLSSALQEVVRPGDSIQFFASPIPDDALPADEDVLRKLDTDTAVDQACTVWGWEFGTVPSTVDAVPNSSWQHRNKSTSNQIYVTRNCFGALAEGGMTLRESRSDRLDGAESVEQTQVDVPFSRFSLAVFEHRDPATKEKVPLSFLSDSLDVSSPIQSDIGPQLLPQQATLRRKDLTKGLHPTSPPVLWYLETEVDLISEVIEQQRILFKQATWARISHTHNMIRLVDSVNVRYGSAVDQFATCWDEFLFVRGRKERVGTRRALEAEYRRINGTVWVCKQEYSELMGSVEMSTKRWNEKKLVRYTQTNGVVKELIGRSDGSMKTRNEEKLKRWMPSLHREGYHLTRGTLQGLGSATAPLAGRVGENSGKNIGMRKWSMSRSTPLFAESVDLKDESQKESGRKVEVIDRFEAWTREQIFGPVEKHCEDIFGIGEGGIGRIGVSKSFRKMNEDGEDARKARSDIPRRMKMRIRQKVHDDIDSLGIRKGKTNDGETKVTKTALYMALLHEHDSITRGLQSLRHKINTRKRKFTETLKRVVEGRSMGLSWRMNGTLGHIVGHCMALEKDIRCVVKEIEDYQEQEREKRERRSKGFLRSWERKVIRGEGRIWQLHKEIEEFGLVDSMSGFKTVDRRGLRKVKRVLVGGVITKFALGSLQWRRMRQYRPSVPREQTPPPRKSRLRIRKHIFGPQLRKDVRSEPLVVRKYTIREREKRRRYVRWVPQKARKPKIRGREKERRWLRKNVRLKAPVAMKQKIGEREVGRRQLRRYVRLEPLVARKYKIVEMEREKRRVRRGVRESKAARGVREKKEREQEEREKLKRTVEGWLNGS